MGEHFGNYAKMQFFEIFLVNPERKGGYYMPEICN